MNLLKQISEAQHPSRLVDLTLREIVQAGKVTNPYQTYVLGVVATAIKNSGSFSDRGLYLEGPVTFSGGATSTEVVNAMKALSDEEATKLAQYLLDSITVGGTVLADPTMTIGEWSKFVLQKQD